MRAATAVGPAYALGVVAFHPPLPMPAKEDLVSAPLAAELAYCRENVMYLVLVDVVVISGAV